MWHSEIPQSRILALVTAMKQVTLSYKQGRRIVTWGGMSFSELLAQSWTEALYSMEPLFRFARLKSPLQYRSPW